MIVPHGSMYVYLPRLAPESLAISFQFDEQRGNGAGCVHLLWNRNPRPPSHTLPVFPFCFQCTRMPGKQTSATPQSSRQMASTAYGLVAVYSVCFQTVLGTETVCTKPAGGPQRPREVSCRLLSHPAPLGWMPDSVRGCLRPASDPQCVWLRSEAPTTLPVATV